MSPQIPLFHIGPGAQTAVFTPAPNLWPGHNVHPKQSGESLSPEPGAVRPPGQGTAMLLPTQFWLALADRLLLAKALPSRQVPESGNLPGPLSLRMIRQKIVHLTNRPVTRLVWKVTHGSPCMACTLQLRSLTTGTGHKFPAK